MSAPLVIGDLPAFIVDLHARIGALEAMDEADFRSLRNVHERVEAIESALDVQVSEPQPGENSFYGFPVDIGALIPEGVILIVADLPEPGAETDDSVCTCLPDEACDDCPLDEDDYDSDETDETYVDAALEVLIGIAEHPNGPARERVDAAVAILKYAQFEQRIVLDAPIADR